MGYTTKKATLVLFVSLLTFASAQQHPVIAKENTSNEPLKVYVNEKLVSFGNQPVREQGRALVPLRETFEALRAEVTWTASTQTIRATDRNNSIVVTVGQLEATVNNAILTLDVPPKIIGTAVYVPLRFVSESLGASVDWKPAEAIVRIKKEYNNETTKTIGQIAQLSTSVFLIEAYDASNELVGTGSGFLADDSGTIITNYHVIRDAKIVRIIDMQQTKYTVNRVLYTDQSRDLAFLSVEEPLRMPKVELGDSNELEIGDGIVAIGSPKGLQNTVSNGIVSGFRSFDGQALIQITAPITFGSSGGALFDMSGRVVGVTSSGIDAHGNLNFAIPINDVKKALKTAIRQSEKSFSRYIFQKDA